MIYGRDSGAFVTNMYLSPVPLKQGEKHCPYCGGYAIRPVLRQRGQKTQEHEDCTFCDKKGKTPANLPA